MHYIKIWILVPKAAARVAFGASVACVVSGWRSFCFGLRPLGYVAWR